jgi:hypothetical protein
VSASLAQRRLIVAIRDLVDATGGPVVLGDALTAADESHYASTKVACVRRGYLVRGDGPPGAPVWDVTPAGRAEVAF